MQMMIKEESDQKIKNNEEKSPVKVDETKEGEEEALVASN